MQTAQVYSPTTWAKQRRNEFRAGQLSQQQSINLPNVGQDADENERKIVNEFCHFLEKSKQLFNGLRDLPQYGHKQWQSYFGRTFDVYTKLWKFQQQNRQILDLKYGLKRWQIGEVASKIGQLYYHYYLRTSETNYLNESFAFYSAIRMRGYYSKTSKEERPDLTVKKLRYYARFVVVCLLLKKMSLVKELVRELARQIEEYTSTYGPEDQLEWTLVLGEIRAFVEADHITNVFDQSMTPLTLTHRLTPATIAPLDEAFLPSPHSLNTNTLSLQEILIVGNCHEQIKFSELTLDMFRVLQTLEREPQEECNTQLFDASPAPGKAPFESMMKRDNPHKYLLYKPTISQLLAFLASGFKELPSNGIMLLYLSADGFFGAANHDNQVTKDPPWVRGAYDVGGVVTNSRRETDHHTRNKRAGVFKEMHCLHPGDLFTFTRKPFFLIIDSNNSHAFKNWPNLFGQPLVCLLSPQDVPVSFEDQHRRGNLFTLFLHSPLLAFCFLCHVTELDVLLWDECQLKVDKFIRNAGKCFAKSRNLDLAFVHFYTDDFLRTLMLRYVFCHFTLSLHKLFRNPRYQPCIYPNLPVEDILANPSLTADLLDLASTLNVTSQLHTSLPT